MRLNYAPTLLCIPVLSFINVAFSQARNPHPMPPVHLRHKRLDSSIDVVGTVTSVALISPSIFSTSVSVPTLTATLPSVSFPASFLLSTTTESSAGPSLAPTSLTSQSVPAFTSQPQVQAATSATGHSSTTYVHVSIPRTLGR
ncbi:hypothetical protein EDC04DRAFT_625832 [Pisolithus marmoratus]|nr:hypothetical protein EDC04DRAFT_625832 [Pisolithus marmoratus]